jgi:chorismate lyase/3-hydroxybenzoate synthase
MCAVRMNPVSVMNFLPRYARSAPDDALAAVSLPLRQLGPEPLIEVWPPSDDVIFGYVTLEETKPLEELTREVYARLIREVRASGHPYFLRIWNHVGSLNEHERGLERYQWFCAGRHDAFIDAGYHHDVDLPAASCVGMPGRGLVLYYLASREPGVQIENPRQVSAYHYPRQYGPKSPSFSRATSWRDTLFVAGTSSVVGHETVHAGDVAAQLDETLRNIETLVPLERIVAAKTYVRNARDYDVIAKRLEHVFASNLFVEADICRPDLLLEIEAVAHR